MKRIIALLLAGALCLLCFGCGTAKSPKLRYDGTTAYYTQEGSTYTMDLQFESPVTKGSTVVLLLEEEEILSFTAEEDFSRLSLSSVKLEANRPYTLSVNGTLQCHGKSRGEAYDNELGYIPEPTLSTIAQEPMGEVPVETTAPTETENYEDSPFGTPPTIAEETVTSLLGNVVPTTGDVNSDGTLTTEPITADKAENSALRPNTQIGGTTFTITGTVTGFTSVRNAS